MENIKVIRGNYVQGSYQHLREALDRVRGALHFADLCETYANEDKVNLSRWCYRASLSDFKSIFDVLPTDFRKMKLDKIWDRSPYKTQLEDMPLVKVLSKARDLAIHNTKLPGDHKEVLLHYTDENGQNQKSVNYMYINQIEENFAVKGMGNISSDDLEWFNRQSNTWPANLLVVEAIYQSSKPISGFLSINLKHSA